MSDAAPPPAEPEEGSTAPGERPATPGTVPEFDSPPPGKVDPAFADPLKLFTVLYRANAALQEKSRQDIARHGLTAAEFAALEALYHRGPLLQGEIQSKILVSSGGITYLVDRLVARGLVQRTECPSDRRARYASLTDEGVTFMSRIFPEHARCIARAAASLDPDEQRLLATLLKRLGRAAASAPPCGDAPDDPHGASATP